MKIKLSIAVLGFALAVTGCGSSLLNVQRGLTVTAVAVAQAPDVIDAGHAACEETPRKLAKEGKIADAKATHESCVTLTDRAIAVTKDGRVLVVAAYTAVKALEAGAAIAGGRDAAAWVSALAKAAADLAQAISSLQLVKEVP